MEHTPFDLVSLDQVQSSIDTNLDLYFDSETYNFNEKGGFYGSVALAQFYQETWDKVLMVRWPNGKNVAALLDTCHVVMQNGAYDITTIQEQTGTVWIPKTWDDTLFLGRLKWFKESSFTLDNMMMYALGFDPYAGQKLNKKELQKTNWGAKELTQEQLVYAATDVYYLPVVYHACKDYINDDSYRLDMVTMNWCLDMQNNGMPVDETKRLAMIRKNKESYEAMNMPINVNSYKQVRGYLDVDSSDGLFLATLVVRDGREDAKAVIDAKSFLKQNSYLKKFESDDHRIYGKFGPWTRSGRLSCKDQNLQQIPSKTKGVFGFPEGSDRVLVYADFSQLELRTVCAVAGDPVMEQLYRNEEDMHAHARDSIHLLSKMEDKKAGRQVGKTCNFNLTYGGSAGMLGGILIKNAGIILDEDELQVVRNGWRDLFPAIKSWQDKGASDWRSGKPWKTPLGRRYVGDRMTDQLNIQIQGGGADVAKYAFNLIMKQLKEEFDSSVKMCNFIHDSYIIECPNDPAVYKRIADIVGSSMKKAWEVMSAYFKIKDLPNPVDVHVGYNWGDIENESIENIYDVEF